MTEEKQPSRYVAVTTGMLRPDTSPRLHTIPLY